MSKAPRRRMTKFVLTLREQSRYSPREASIFQVVVPAQLLVRLTCSIPSLILIVGISRARLGATTSPLDKAVFVVHLIPDPRYHFFRG